MTIVDVLGNLIKGSFTIIAFVVFFGIALLIAIAIEYPVYFSLFVLVCVYLIYRSVCNGRRRKMQEEEDEQAYTDQLIESYGEEDAYNILNRILWVGQTSDQVLLSFGTPHDIRVQQLKTMKKEIWCYGKVSRGKYDTTVTFVDGLVQTYRKS